VLYATNATLRSASRRPVPQLSLSITRELIIASGRLYYMVRVHNFLAKPVTTTVSLALAADFADMFEVRGASGRTARGHALAPKRTERGLTLAYVGEDEAFRETVIELGPVPERLDLEADRAQAHWEAVLEPGLPAEIMVSAEPSIGGRRRPRRRLATAMDELRDAETRWRSRCTAIASDNERFDELIATSARDLRALTMPAPGSQILAAGIPWFVAPFGRDALMAAGDGCDRTPSDEREPQRLSRDRAALVRRSAGEPIAHSDCGPATHAGTARMQRVRRDDVPGRPVRTRTDLLRALTYCAGHNWSREEPAVNPVCGRAVCRDEMLAAYGQDEGLRA